MATCGAVTLEHIGIGRFQKDLTHLCGAHYPPTESKEAPVAIVKGSPPIEPAPEGTYRAVCVDEYELEPKQTKYGMRDRIRLVFELEELNPKAENKPYTVWATFGASIGTKSYLGKFLSAWRGQKFTPEDLKNGFDLEKVVGVSCQIQIVHSHADDGTVYGNVEAVMPLAKGMTKLAPSGHYTRMKDRDDKQAASAAHPDPDDDLPF
jgi:hypothetical protein